MGPNRIAGCTITRKRAVIVPNYSTGKTSTLTFCIDPGLNVSLRLIASSDHRRSTRRISPPGNARAQLTDRRFQHPADELSCSITDELRHLVTARASTRQFDNAMLLLVAYLLGRFGLCGNNHFNPIRRLFTIQPYTTFEHSSRRGKPAIKQLSNREDHENV